MNETIVISLGGAMIVPENLNIDFLKDFKKLIVSHVEQGKRFVIITGGGKTCRNYQNAAKEISQVSNEDLDWIGISTCNLNAELLRTVFSEYANKKVVTDLASEFNIEKSVVIGGAYAPGHSSDFDAFLAAKNLGAKKVINLSNTDYVYDKDPKTNPDAKKLEKISWAEYRALIPKEWNPGLNSPFDPIASEMAENEGITVVTMNGKNIENLEKCLNGEEFAGTTIY